MSDRVLYYPARGSGSGSSDTFQTVQTDTGTYPVASGASILTLTSVDGSVLLTGDSGTDTVDFSVVGFLPLTGGTLTGFLTLNADPTSSLHAATMQYVDNLVNGLKWKTLVVAATTANITLSGAQTIDGISIVAGDRVLVKDQSTQSDNGIYVAAVGAWSRSTDADTGSELDYAAVAVSSGTANAGKAFTQTTQPVTLGVSNIVWAQFLNTTYTADGNGIELSGQTFSLELDGTTLSKSSSGLKVTDNTFLKLAGVSGGQTAYGSTSTTSGLTLIATSGVGTTGADIIFKVGNNGGTEAGRFNNAGYLEIPTTYQIGQNTGLTTMTGINIIGNSDFRIYPRSNRGIKFSDNGVIYMTPVNGNTNINGIALSTLVSGGATFLFGTGENRIRIRDDANRGGFGGGNDLATISADGCFLLGTSNGSVGSVGRWLQINALRTTDTNLTLKAIASQSGKLLEAQDLSGTPVTTIDASGNLNVSGTIIASGGSVTNGSASTFFISNTVGRIEFQNQQNSAANIIGFKFNLSASQTPATGDTIVSTFVGTFAPTSGTATFSTLSVNPTINQTGGASGITRGIYINPTITAAADFRAIEVATGNSFFGTTSGSVGIGTTSTTALLNINTVSAANIGLIIQGVSSQSGDLIQFKDSAGTVRGSFSSNGTLKSQIFSPQSVGTWTFQNANGGTSTLFQNNSTITTANGLMQFQQTGSWQLTSGDMSHVLIQSNFNPTSGTATMAGLRLSPVINQTGGANGISSGIFIDATLTSAADFRCFYATAGKTALPLTTSSAGTLTLANFTTYVFTGTTTTWTVPAVSGMTGVIFYLKNRGSGSITLNSTNSNELYDTAATSTVTITAGSAIIIQNDGTYWVVM